MDFRGANRPCSTRYTKGHKETNHVFEMPGGKQSRQALFEEINFKIYHDGDKTTAFMTSKENLPLWIRCLDDFYRGRGNKAQETYEIEWSKSDQQAKVMAQIQEQVPPDIARGATKLGNLTISFYLTTYRVHRQPKLASLKSV